MRFKITIIIERPVAEVFRYTTSPAKLSEWMQDFQGIRPIEGRRSKVGGKSKITMKDARSSYSITEEVLVFERDQRFKVRLDHTEIITTIDYQFQARQKHTLLTAHYQVHFKNIINRIFGAFFKIPMKNQQKADFERLKTRIEAL